MSNGRKVSTDALETLGTIIDDTQKRDAIHLAVEPVIAATDLKAGQHIRVRDGFAHPAYEDDGQGIVDPFLPRPVREGDRFWFVMYPRMVTSLRHVWSHPDFPSTEVAVAVDASKAASEKWLRDFCDHTDCPGYDAVMAAAIDSDNSDYLRINGDASGEIPMEFWDHVEIVTGRKGLSRASYFSCSC